MAPDSQIKEALQTKKLFRAVIGMLGSEVKQNSMALWQQSGQKNDFSSEKQKTYTKSTK